MQSQLFRSGICPQEEKLTRRDRFLADLEAITPWDALLAVLTPAYPAGGGPGRPPIGLERMLRMYLVQQCFGLSDEGMEDAIYDSQAIRRFVGIDLSQESAPDATTLLKFRRLLEEKASDRIAVSGDQRPPGRTGPVPARRHHRRRHPDCRPRPRPRTSKANAIPRCIQSKKGNQWYFGMKAHIGVDAHSGLVHSVIGTAGHVADILRPKPCCTAMKPLPLVMRATGASTSAPKVKHSR